MRRLILGAFAAVAALAAGPAAAGAYAEYCDWDPPVAIVTPAGNLVTVHDSVWTSSVLNIGTPVTTYAATRTYDRKGNAETAVDMAITVPAGLLYSFQVQDYVATGPLLSGTVLASASGYSGQTLHLYFTLQTP